MWFCYYNNDTKRTTYLNMALMESVAFSKDSARIFPNRPTEDCFEVKGEDRERLEKMMEAIGKKP